MLICMYILQQMAALSRIIIPIAWTSDCTRDDITSLLGLVATAINLHNNNPRNGVNAKVAVEFRGVEAELSTMFISLLNVTVFKFTRTDNRQQS